MATLQDALFVATRVVIRAAEESTTPVVTSPRPSRSTCQNNSNRNNETQCGNQDKGGSPVAFYVAVGIGVVFTSLGYVLGPSNLSLLSAPVMQLPIAFINCEEFRHSLLN